MEKVITVIQFLLLSRGWEAKNPWLSGLSYVHSRYTNGLANTDPLFGYFKIDGVSVGLVHSLKWPDNYFTLMQSINFNRYNTQNYTAIFSFGGGMEPIMPWANGSIIREIQ